MPLAKSREFYAPRYFVKGVPVTPPFLHPLPNRAIKKLRALSEQEVMKRPIGSSLRRRQRSYGLKHDLYYAALLRAASFAVEILAFLASIKLSMPGATPASVNSAKITSISVAPSAFATSSR